METLPEKRKPLTMQELEGLSQEEFDRLPESTKEAFYHYMTLDNTPREFMYDWDGAWPYSGVDPSYEGSIREDDDIY